MTFTAEKIKVLDMFRKSIQHIAHNANIHFSVQKHHKVNKFKMQNVTILGLFHFVIFVI